MINKANSIKELNKILSHYRTLFLNRDDTHNVTGRLSTLSEQYYSSLDGLELNPDPSDTSAVRELNRAKKGITLIDSLVDIMSQMACINSDSTNAMYDAVNALAREGLFTPTSIYQIKEDLEMVSQLHTKYKKESDRLIEEGQLAIARNAKLRIENVRLQGLLDERQ